MGLGDAVDYKGFVVTEDMKVMIDESFGPILPVLPFDSEEEAVRIANNSVYGLNASVWSSDIDKAKRVESKILSGSCAINDVIKNIAHAEMPFGGVKQSGIGRYHGKEGVYAFSHVRSIMINPGTAKHEINWFPLTKEAENAIQGICKVILHGILRNIPSLLRALRVILRCRKGPLQISE